MVEPSSLSREKFEIDWFYGVAAKKEVQPSVAVFHGKKSHALVWVYRSEPK
jgi:hypothetical protein